MRAHRIAEEIGLTCATLETLGRNIRGFLLPMVYANLIRKHNDYRV